MLNHDQIHPYNTIGSKKEQVAEMFDTIAPKYDFLNHFLSMGIDKIWRLKVVNILKKCSPKNILDVATGTGDLALSMLTLHPDKITGIDISNQMLEIGRQKISSQKLESKIELLYGDSENIAFADNTFDAITAAFGVRNFENLKKGLSEMLRVLQPNGTLVILEFSRPKNWFFKKIYYYYFCNVLPWIGKIISRDNRAYTYLPESVNAFPDGKDFVKILEETGFKTVECRPLTFGISSIYTAKK